MFLKKINAKSFFSTVIQENCKSLWYADARLYKKFLYEDFFIRQYVRSFFYKWSKLSCNKVLGSVYIARTAGKLCVTVFFFHSIKKLRRYSTLGKVLKGRIFNFLKLDIKPLTKYKKQLVLFTLFFTLEKFLKVQCVLRYVNISNPISLVKTNTFILGRITSFLFKKLIYFRYQLADNLYPSTINIVVHLFKFRQPDSTLFANFLAAVLPKVRKPSRFLFFLRKIIIKVRKIFHIVGVRVVIAGKLGGFSRAQLKQIQVGPVSLQRLALGSFTSCGYSSAFTRAGKVGIKVLICN